jgi:hypothetical protein
MPYQFHLKKKNAMPILMGKKRSRKRCQHRLIYEEIFLFPSPCTAMDCYFKHAAIYKEIRFLIFTFHGVAFIPNHLLHILDPKPGAIT